MGEVSPRSKVINKAIQFVLPRLTDRADLSSVSRVCTAWHEADRETRERVTVPLCYAVSPSRLSGRFPNLKSLRLKGTPRAGMFELVPPFLGGLATPWINEVAISKFSVVKSLRFKRILISDLDLDVLARALAAKLVALELKYCYGFTTDGLLSITKQCRNLERLLIAWSTLMEDKSGEWLHEVALHNTSLRILHCHETNFSKVSLQDLEAIAEKCKTLVSLKVSDFDLVKLEGTLRAATQLEEFYGGCIIEDPDNTEDDDKYINVHKWFPPKLCRIGDLVDMHVDQITILYGISTKLQTLDLFRTVLGVDAHCLVLQRSPNLEVLRTSWCIGDEGLVVLSQCCHNLKELEIRPSADDEDDHRYPVTDTGIIAVAANLKKLESVTVAMTEVTNDSLLAIAENLKELVNFDLLVSSMKTIECPLDIGVRALLSQCENLKKISLHLLPGYLTDLGLIYLGKFGTNLKQLKLVFAGDSDVGLHELASGCTSLQKLELVYCDDFTEKGLANAVRKLSALRYFSVYGETDIKDFSFFTPEWKIMSSEDEDCHCLVAYPSLDDIKC